MKKCKKEKEKKKLLGMLFTCFPAFSIWDSMLTNNHHQRVAALAHYSPSFPIMTYLGSSISQVQKLDSVVLLYIPSKSQSTLTAARQAKRIPNVYKNEAQFGTAAVVQPKVFEPLFLSMMKLFPLVALFSPFFFFYFCFTFS